MTICCRFDHPGLKNLGLILCYYQATIEASTSIKIPNKTYKLYMLVPIHILGITIELATNILQIFYWSRKIFLLEI